MIDRETSLWEAFRQGDKAAFEQLLLRYYRPLYDYGLRFQRDPEQLRDALHDLMLDLWERRSHLRATGNLKLYLFKALRNQIFRGKQKNQNLMDFLELEEAGAPTEGDPAFGFVEEESAQKQAFLIRQTLSRLSRRQREVLYLKFFEDMSNEQIANLFGVSRAAVANLLSTSLKAFKAVWKPELFLFLLAVTH